MGLGGSMIVEIANRQTRLPLDVDRLRECAQLVLAAEGFISGVVSVAVVDDPTIHALNREYLNHDYATDVLSFVFDVSDEGLEGEVIVSADTAIRESSEFGWSADSELALYLVHGLLHLAGYDDHTDLEREEMRRLERKYLTQLGISVPASDT